MIDFRWDTMLATATGGVIAIAASWLQQIWRNRQTLEDWFDEHYMMQGVDQAIQLTLALMISTVSKQTGNVSAPEIPSPVECLTRVETLTGDRTMTALLLGTYIDRAAIHEGYVSFVITGQINIIRTALIRLRTELCRVKIRSRSDVYRVSKRTAVLRLVGDLMTELEEAPKLNGSSGSRLRGSYVAHGGYAAFNVQKSEP